MSEIVDLISGRINQSWECVDVSEYPNKVYNDIYVHEREAYEIFYILRENIKACAKELDNKYEDLEVEEDKLFDFGYKNIDENEMVGILNRSILYLGLVVAASNDGEDECIDGIFPDGGGILGFINQSDWLERTVLCEVAYMDQHVSERSQAKLNSNVFDDDKGDKEGENNDTDWDPWTPPLREYWKRWRYLDTEDYLDNNDKRIENQDGDESLKVIAVTSLKGGVGKSLISGAIAHHVADPNSETGEYSRAAVIDLDASGPSTQFTFNVPGVTEKLKARALPDYEEGSGLPRKHPKNGWTYSSWADYYLSDDKSISGMKGIDNDNIQFFLMPDSPMYGANVKASEGTVGDINHMKNGIEEILDGKIGRKQDCVVVIDFHPGLSGSNGALLQFLDKNYDTSILCMTSPRASDLAGTITEISNLYGMRQYKSGPALIVNRWVKNKKDTRYEDVNEEEEFVTYMDNMTEKTFKNLRNINEMTSGDLIYLWRLWAYLYIRLYLDDNGRRRGKSDVRAERWEDFEVLVVPENDNLQTTMNPNIGSENLHIKVDWSSVEGTLKLNRLLEFLK